MNTAVIITIISIFCVLVLTPKLRKWLMELDIYDANHSDINGLIVVRNTYLGGFATLVWGGLALSIVGSLLTGYLINNTIESKSLVPYLILMEEDIEVNFR